MKSSLGKLKKFALNSHKEKNNNKSDQNNNNNHRLHQFHELAQASLDMEDMRNCYDSLLSAAAATANSAYEFSESLRDMGTCLHEKTVLNDDDESSNLLSMLGDVQFELQKTLDCYRSHVSLTITTPSQSLLNELCTVEEMKRQCDEKRSLYEHMVAQQKERVRSKGGKIEGFSPQQLQAACDEYNEEATLCIFRLKSLKQGQCRSLVTQAARHHAAQLNFFRKGLKLLEAVEPQMRLIAEKEHIDYDLTVLEDGEDDAMNSFASNDDLELSFDYSRNKQGHEAEQTSRNSMELDPAETPHHQASANAEVAHRERRLSSYSAPIFAEKKSDPSEMLRDMQPSKSRKCYSYVLPTPDDARGVLSARTTKSVSSQPRQLRHTGSFQHLVPISISESETHEKALRDDSSLPSNPKVQLRKELSSNNLPVQLPPTLAHEILRPHFDANHAYDTKKAKRQAYSGPLTSKSSTTKPGISVSGPMAPSELPQLVTGLFSRVPTFHAPFSSSKVSPSASPPLSSPKISELHELPRPPDGLASKAVASSSGHSAPLGFRNQEPSSKTRSTGGAFGAASPLPTPPLAVSRSFSIPSNYQRSTASYVTRLSEPSQHLEKSEGVDSPPLTPISLSRIKLLPKVSEMPPDSGKTKGKS